METEAGAAQAFQAWALTYDQTVSQELERMAGITHQEMLNRLLALAQPQAGDLVLDVGTGTGWLAIRSALETGMQVVGVDITPEMLTQAALNAEKVGVRERVHFVPASAMSLPYPEAAFHVVLSSLALHHTAVRQSLAEMVRVLRPGGRLAIADMAAPSTWRSAPISWLIGLLVKASRLLGNPRARAEIEAFQQTYTVPEWRGLLTAQGLEKVQVMAILRPGQRFYPGVVFASGEKRAG
jgi:ubiquinone/menaquinone biosynthesis C-methylase UbiE